MLDALQVKVQPDNIEGKQKARGWGTVKVSSRHRPLMLTNILNGWMTSLLCLVLSEHLLYLEIMVTLWKNDTQVQGELWIVMLTNTSHMLSSTRYSARVEIIIFYISYFFKSQIMICYHSQYHIWYRIVLLCINAWSEWGRKKMIFWDPGLFLKHSRASQCRCSGCFAAVVKLAAKQSSSVSVDSLKRVPNEHQLMAGPFATHNILKGHFGPCLQ